MSCIRMKVVTRLFRPSQSVMVAEDFLRRALDEVFSSLESTSQSENTGGKNEDL